MVTGNLIFAFFSITIGSSFQFGYQTGVINQPLGLIQNFIKNVTLERFGYVDDGYPQTISSLCVSSFLIGGLFGGLFGGYMGKKLGRRTSLLILTCPCTLGCILLFTCKLAKSFEMIIVGRLLVGLACGAYTAIGPMYLSEVAPLGIRGAAGVLNQLVIVLSILISQILGLPMVMGTDVLWPILLGLNAVVCIISFFCILLCPESPRYLYLIKGDVGKTHQVLRRLRGPLVSIQEDLDDLQRESENTPEKMSIIDLFRQSHLRHALLVAIAAQLAQQLSGINGVLYYSVELFKANGLSELSATFANLGIGATLFAITLVSVFVIDRIGRRPLLIGGLSVAWLCLIIFTVSLIIKQQLSDSGWSIYLAITMIYIFICGFGIGPGAIPWFIAAEMFNQDSRDAAISVAVLVNWLCNIAVGLVFIQLIAHLGIYAFMPFIIIISVVIGLLYIYLPETKGRSSTDIESEFRTRSESGDCCCRMSRTSHYPADDNSEILLSGHSEVESKGE